MPELATEAILNGSCANVATEIFSRRLASETITFKNDEASFPLSFRILERFGPLISKLSLKFIRKIQSCISYDAAQYRNLMRMVNQQCRNSLIEFEIYYSSDCDVDIFNEIKGQFGPFELAKTVSIQITSTTVETKNLQLNTIFPNVRHLDLNFASITDWKFIDCEYRNLDELSIAGRLLDKSLDGTFESLLKQNKRIRWISITSPTYHTFHLIHKHLEHLEEFHIRQSINDDPTIQFPHIKKLDIRLAAHACSLPNHTQFNSALEELVLHCAYSDIDEKYFTFLSKYQKVKNLTVGVELNKSGLMKLIGKYPNLSEANIGFRNDVTADDIAKFVKESKRLNVLTFMYISMENSKKFEEQLLLQIHQDFKTKFKSSGASNVEFQVQRKIPIGSGTRVLASSVFILFAVIMHINRLVFF